MRPLLRFVLSVTLFCAAFGGAGCDQIRDTLKNGGILASQNADASIGTQADAARNDQSAEPHSDGSAEPVPDAEAAFVDAKHAADNPTEPVGNTPAEAATAKSPEQVAKQTKGGEEVSAVATDPGTAGSSAMDATTGEAGETEGITRASQEAGSPNSGAAAEDAAGGVPQLRYGWKLGRDYPYKVRIDVKYADSTETLSGTPVYHVKASDRLSTTLEFHGKLVSNHRQESGFPVHPDPFRYGLFSPFSGVASAQGGTEHEVVLDAAGNVKQVRGASQLPYLLGNLSLLVLDPLPEKPRRSWSESNDVTIRVHSSRGPFPSSRFGGFPRSRFFGPGQSDAELLDAEEKIDFKIVSVEKSTALIFKDYELKSAEMLGDVPRFSIVGHGETLFDLHAGVPLRCEFNLCVASEGQAIDRGVPVMVSYGLLTGEEYEQWQVAAAEQRAAQEGPPPGTAERLLRDLASNQAATVRQAAELTTKPLPEGASVEEVFELLVRQLHHPDAGAREAVVKGLATVVREDQLAVLVEALGDASVPVRWAAMDGLARFPTSEAIDALAGRMHDSSDRLPAARLLKAMGAPAEPAMLKLLEADDWRVRQAAVEVLGVIGTRSAVPAIEQAAEGDPDEGVQSAARKALEQLENQP